MIDEEPLKGTILYYDCGLPGEDKWVKIKVLRTSERAIDRVYFVAEIIENHNCFSHWRGMQVGDHTVFNTWIVYKSLEDLYKDWGGESNDKTVEV